jgi:hypothetical protein
MPKAQQGGSRHCYLDIRLVISRSEEWLKVVRFGTRQEIDYPDTEGSGYARQLVHSDGPVFLFDVAAHGSAPADTLGELLLGESGFGSLSAHVACDDDAELGHDPNAMERPRAEHSRQRSACKEIQRSAGVHCIALRIRSD